MKKIKRLAGLILAMIMVVSMTITGFAEETNKTTISVGESDNRSYDVYQIFTGDLSGNVLSNIKWGKNGTGTEGEVVDSEIIDKLTTVNSSSNVEKLADIKQYVNLNSTAIGTVSAGNPLTVHTGYYLFVDKGEVGKGEAYSLYVVEIVGPTTIDPKVGKVESDKKVKDTNDTTEATTDWQDSADYDIGDDVPFKLTGKVAADYDNYKQYYFAFHDIESNGLTFNADSVNVYVDRVKVETGYEVKTNTEDNCTFEVVFANLKEIQSVKAGSVITVEYTSTLNKDAVLGSAGNDNVMYLEYSNNPNDEQGGETGTTPEDKVIVFTYKVIVNKVDKDGKPLEGAGFTLFKKDAKDKYNKVGEELTGDKLTTFEWKGLDDGDYKLEETTTPIGYNTIDPIEFTISAEHATLADNPTLTELKGGNTFTGEVSTGTLTGNVVNQAGTVLPETGGIGTTVFYAIGGVLVLAAVVLLVTKKRMRAE